MFGTSTYIEKFCNGCPYHETCGFLSRHMMCDNADLVEGIIDDVFIKIQETRNEIQMNLVDTIVNGTMSDAERSVGMMVADAFAYTVTQKLTGKSYRPIDDELNKRGIISTKPDMPMPEKTELEEKDE